MTEAAQQLRTPCPFCSEAILPEALVCPHCTRQLVAVPPNERGMVGRSLKIAIMLFLFFFVAIPLLIGLAG